MNTWEFHITLSAKLTFRSISWLQACWTAVWTPPSASKDGPCAWECSGGFFDGWVTTNLFASSHNWSLILSSSWPESPELYYTKVLLPTCPLEKLAINTITAWSPWVCFLCASASLNFKFIDCQWPWLPLKPFSSLRINMGRSRRAGCPVFTLWKATVCTGDLGGCGICRDSYQGQDIKCQAPLLFMHEKTVICHASKFTNMYENLIKCHTFVPLRGLNTTDISFAWGTVVLAAWLCEFCPRLSVSFFFFVTFPSVLHAVYANSQVFCSKKILK